MSKPWTDADARRLKDLRLRAGLDRASFARRCTLSVAQLTELEEGPAGASRFYGEHIKSHTGHNALARLGYQPPPPVEPEPEPEVALASPAQAESLAGPADASPALNRPTHWPGAAEAGAPSQGLPPESQAGDIAPSYAPSHAPVPDELPPSRRGLWLSVAALVMAAGVVLVLLSQPEERAPTGQAPQGQAGAPASTEPTPPAEPQAAASQAVATPASPVASAVAPATAETAATPPALAAASTPSPAPAASQAAAALARCDGPAESTAEFTPPRALRPASYVFLQASQPIAVCVVDARNQQTQATVKPGEDLTVTGEAPFTIHTARWGGLRVFFQGVRVQTEMPSPQSVVLRAR